MKKYKLFKKYTTEEKLHLGGCKSQSGILSNWKFYSDSRGGETLLYKLKLIKRKIFKYLRECLRWMKSKIFNLISSLKKGVYRLIGVLNEMVSGILY